MFDFTVRASEGPSIPTITLHLNEGGFVVGQFILIPHSLQLYELHMSTIDSKLHGRTVGVFKEGIKFVFNDISRLEKLVGYIPVNNRLAIKLAKDIGMTHEGTIKKSFSHDGVMIDQDIYGIDRETLKCQWQ